MGGCGKSSLHVETIALSVCLWVVNDLPDGTPNNRWIWDFVRAS